MNAHPASPKPRYPSGDIIPAKDRSLDPNTVRRIMDEAAKNVRMREFGTAYGRLRLEGQLSDRQFAACHKWAELRREYEIAVGARQAKSAMAVIDSAGGSEPDPDSELGNKIGQAAKRKRAEYEKADAVIFALGSAAYADFRNIVEAGHEKQFAMRAEAGNIRICANALAHFWKM